MDQSMRVVHRLGVHILSTRQNVVPSSKFCYHGGRNRKILPTNMGQNFNYLSPLRCSIGITEVEFSSNSICLLKFMIVPFLRGTFLKSTYFFGLVKEFGLFSVNVHVENSS